jgi:NMD protein affecting ribosome stability and mRNA decay
MSLLRHPKRSLHRHTAVTTHALQQHAGIPYEVERTVCSACMRVLGERPVRRAAA